jgi:polysaccharide export outer membrane protein
MPADRRIGEINMARRRRLSYGSHRAIWAAALLFCFESALVAQTSSPPAPQANLQALPQSVRTELDQAVAAQAAAREAPYRIQRGDDLDIRAFAIPDLNAAVRVRPDGKISLVLLGDIEAAGHTTEELAQAVSSLYSENFRNPKITVIVHNFYNFNVYVGGEVAKPGVVPLSGGLTVASAIFQSGGFKEEEGPRSVLLVHRGEDGAQSVTNLDLDDVLVRGKPDIALQPLDVLYVPKNAINVYVGGEVVEPGLVPLSGRMTALAAVLKARGLKLTARANNVVLLRNSGQGKPVILRVNLQDAITKGRGDLELQPYDVVFVPKSVIARLDQFVNQYLQLLQPISTNVGFTYLLGGTAAVIH